MKKHLIVLIGLVFFSCSTISDDTPTYYQDILAVESVNMPEELEINTPYQINLTYLKPTNCHSFNGIYYLKHNNERTVAIISNVFQGSSNCQAYEEDLIPEVEASFNFTATELGSYIFKFWQGQDENAQDNYLTMEVPVVE